MIAKIKPLKIEKLITERLILIPFTIPICENLMKEDFSDLIPLGLKRGKSWPDDDLIEILPKIIDKLIPIGVPSGFESWMIIKNDTMEVIGDIGFKGFNFDENNIDLGYGIITEERRKGYTEEAAKALMKWAFSNEFIKEITARCLVDNLGSVNLLKKLNFQEIKRNEGMIYWSMMANLNPETISKNENEKSISNS